MSPSAQNRRHPLVAQFVTFRFKAKERTRQDDERWVLASRISRYLSLTPLFILKSSPSSILPTLPSIACRAVKTFSQSPQPRVLQWTSSQQPLQPTRPMLELLNGVLTVFPSVPARQSKRLSAAVSKTKLWPALYQYSIAPQPIADVSALPPHDAPLIPSWSTNKYMMNPVSSD